MKWLLDAITVIVFSNGCGNLFDCAQQYCYEVMRDEIIRYGLIIGVISILVIIGLKNIRQQKPCSKA